MEDASHKQQLTLDHMLSGSVKRLSVQRVGGDKRPHKEQPQMEDGNEITPTPSHGSLSTGEFSDIEIPSDDSRLSVLEREHSTGTVVEANNLEKEKIKVALKLDRLKDKLSRYESHVNFLRKCVDNNIIPTGLRTYVEPSIGNRDDVFLEGWHGILFDCSKKLINHSVDFSVKIIETTKTEIKATEEQLKALVPEPAYKKIESSLKKNDEIRNKDLTSRKNRKFYRLKYGEKERDDRQPAPNNRKNEILNNRGQRGQGQPRRSDENNFTNRRDNERSRWNDGQPDQRQVANNMNSNARSTRDNERSRWNEGQPGQGHVADYNNSYARNTSDDQAQRRVIEVIERRTNNQTNRGPRATLNNQPPIHEKIALSRRNSRRNLARNDDSPREDFPPLRRETREEPHDTNRMDDAGRERARNNEIEALRKRIEALQRERTNTTNLPTIEISDGASKNGGGAQGPSSEPTNDMDMKQYIRNALAIISGFAERLEQQSDSALTRSETS